MSLTGTGTSSSRNMPEGTGGAAPAGLAGSPDWVAGGSVGSGSVMLFLCGCTRSSGSILDPLQDERPRPGAVRRLLYQSPAVHRPRIQDGPLVRRPDHAGPATR